MMRYLLLSVFLIGCGPEPEYIDKCVESHTEIRVMYFPNGSGGLRMQPMPVTVCDKYETIKNPKYKPKEF